MEEKGIASQGYQTQLFLQKHHLETYKLFHKLGNN